MKNEKMNIEAQADALKSGVNDLQKLREKQYRQAVHLHEQHSSLRKREQERLAKKYGKSDARVQAAKQQNKQYAQYGESLVKQERRTSQAMQTAPKGGFVLQGMVISESRKPQSNLNLGLSDKEGQWIRSIGAACTDEHGFYRFSIDAKLVKAYQDQKFILNVINEKKEVIYRDKQPVTLVPDKSEARNIILPDKVCQLPEDKVIVKSSQLEIKTRSDIKEDPGFRISGAVTDAQGVKMAGITVKAELISGKSSTGIGQAALTDKAGQYLITYTSKEIADLPLSRTMTIKLSCFDAKGRLLGTAEAPQDLDRNTTIDVKLRA